MGAMKVKTHWDIRDRLDEIPQKEWRSIVLSKGHWIKDAIDNRLATALELLDEIEQHEAWKAADMDREGFLRFVCFIEPDDLPYIREGYRIMRQRGLNPQSRGDAIAAARAEVDQYPQGGAPRSKPYVRIASGGNGSAYRLRRLARHKPAVLERYERGEFASVEAAYRHAFALDDLRRAWKHASEQDRTAFLKEIGNDRKSSADDHRLLDSSISRLSDDPQCAVFHESE
jgi:hypothetical protein